MLDVFAARYGMQDICRAAQRTLRDARRVMRQRLC